MNRYVCIHGHFYQPPRENPWLEEVELQDSAFPYHDWNEKITAECYSQNAASRILDSDKKIIDIVNNYSQISFNFGPTLMSWLERHAPDVYKSILDADQKSLERFSGHGAAIAQVYNHIIMPLANTKDKHTQVIWAIEDFKQRFKRKPEGMWLPETAVNIETLDVLAQHDIKFTILAPHQARRICKKDTKNWQDVNKKTLNTAIPYLCTLPTGRLINIFFYNGPVSYDISFSSGLNSGDIFAKRLTDVIAKDTKEAQLANIATDGEVYGHHHRFADMALAFCLNYIETNDLAKITVYGEYLEKFPPEYEVEIIEDTSWSCIHGIERWKSNCGCCSGRFPCGTQQYREPLWKAMNWLRDELAPLYEEKMKKYVPDPWELRNKYISVINDRSAKNVNNFLLNSVDSVLLHDDKVAILKLLEMQRNAMLMYTSCGWFFDDISGIETVQVLNYASRAIQLANEIEHKDFEAGFLDIIEKAPSNFDQYINGRNVYETIIKSNKLDFNRVAANLAVSSLFEDSLENIKKVYCYSIYPEYYHKMVSRIIVFAVGKAAIQCNITFEKHSIDFAVLHFGDQNLICSVNSQKENSDFESLQKNMTEAFSRGDTTEVMRLMNISFSGNNYSLWHLFKDQQRKILYRVLDNTWKEIEASFRHIIEHNYTIMQLMRSIHMPLPKALFGPTEFILDLDLRITLQQDPLKLDRLQTLADEVTRLPIELDQTLLSFEASHKLNQLMNKLAIFPEDIDNLQTINTVLTILRKIVSQLDLQKTQNIFFNLNKNIYPVMSKKADLDDELAKKWVEIFRSLAENLAVKVL